MNTEEAKANHRSQAMPPAPASLCRAAAQFNNCVQATPYVPLFIRPLNERSCSVFPLNSNWLTEWP